MHVVIDIEINGFLRAFDKREDALAYVGRLLETNGERYVLDLAIGRQTAEGRVVDIVTGDDLLTLMREDAEERALALAGHGAAIDHS
jgi:hypothetical protein